MVRVYRVDATAHPRLCCVVQEAGPTIAEPLLGMPADSTFQWNSKNSAGEVVPGDGVDVCVYNLGETS